MLVTEVSQSVETKPQVTEGFDVIYPVNKSEDEKSKYEEKIESVENCISPEELAMNRVSERGIIVSFKTSTEKDLVPNFYCIFG